MLSRCRSIWTTLRTVCDTPRKENGRLLATSRPYAGVRPTYNHIMENMRKTLTAVVAGLLLSLAFATVAIGQSSTEEGYNPTGPEVVNKVDDQAEDQVPASANNSSPGNDSELPFTGLDLALLAGAGGMLLALGFGMRRLTRSPESA